MILLETSNLENYHEFDVSKYNIFWKCSTHGYYMLRKSCISKPRIRGSFRDLEFPRKSGKSWEFAIGCPRDSSVSRIILVFLHIVLRGGLLRGSLVLPPPSDRKRLWLAGPSLHLGARTRGSLLAANAPVYQYCPGRSPGSIRSSTNS